MLKGSKVFQQLKRVENVEKERWHEKEKL